MKQQKLLKRFMLLLVMLPAATFISAQEQFIQQQINRRVSEYNHVGIDQSSPLSYYLSRAYIMAEGKMGQMAKMSTAKFELDTCEVNVPVDSAKKQRILDEKILKIVIYKDSVAAIVTEYSENWQLFSYTWIENGKWMNGGQGMAEGMENTDRQIKENLPLLYQDLPRIKEITTPPTDTRPFADFLKQQHLSPEKFVLQQIAKHKLVINGEYHRRKVSWDMLRRLIALPDFSKACGTIFMELPSREQPTMDLFLGTDKLNGELILNIFRNEQLHGWWDKGEYDFICDIWRLNQLLPQEKRIKIQLVDFQIPYSQIQTAEEYREAIMRAENRNTHMADVIEQYIKTKSDTRGCLFLVGCAHVFKSNVAGIASAGGDGKEEMTAGAQLAQRFGSKNVFTVFQHVLPCDNSGRHRSFIRGGVFDQAFAENGNQPVGFLLQGSPFGKEPFDGIYELKYKAGTGTYQDNFDGYLFLHSLKDEPQSTPLLEVFNDEFVTEIQRRSTYFDWNGRSEIFFGHKVSELTKELIHKELTK
jgi:hypothetical protein